MIGYLKGKIIYLGLDYLILDVNNVGYKIFVFNILKFKKDDLENFWIHQNIKEDSNDLYGFTKVEQLEFFKLLLKVNGVGPKMAMNILRKNNINELKQNISTGDVKLLTAVGGVGKKIAAKIIVELKGKISDNQDINFLDSQTEEVIDALKGLGYKQNEIIPYIKKIPSNINSVEKKITWILKSIR